METHSHVQLWSPSLSDAQVHVGLGGHRDLLSRVWPEAGPLPATTRASFSHTCDCSPVAIGSSPNGTEPSSLSLSLAQWTSCGNILRSSPGRAAALGLLQITAMRLKDAPGQSPLSQVSLTGVEHREGWRPPHWALAELQSCHLAGLQAATLGTPTALLNAHSCLTF